MDTGARTHTRISCTTRRHGTRRRAHGAKSWPVSSCTPCRWCVTPTLILVPLACAAPRGGIPHFGPPQREGGAGASVGSEAEQEHHHPSANLLSALAVFFSRDPFVKGVLANAAAVARRIILVTTGRPGQKTGEKARERGAAPSAPDFFLVACRLHFGFDGSSSCVPQAPEIAGLWDTFPASRSLPQQCILVVLAGQWQVLLAAVWCGVWRLYVCRVCMYGGCIGGA